MTKLTTVHTERVFEDELTDHLAANGWSIRTHLKNADRLQPRAGALPRRPAGLRPGDPAGRMGQVQEVAQRRLRADARQARGRAARHAGARCTCCATASRTATPSSSSASSCRPTGRTRSCGRGSTQNRLTVIRQLHYSLHNENSIDLVLFVNGLPVATAELKTDLTQNIQDAILQYRKDRPPKDPKTKEPEPLLQFKTRALVHFAVSTDEVFMTTKLDGRRDLVPALQPGQARRHGRRRRRQPAGAGGQGLPDLLPVGAGLVAQRAGSTSSATSCTWRRRRSRSTARW